MEDPSFFVGVIGNIISVLMFLSPVRTFWNIVSRGSTEDFSSFPYICTLLNCCLWTYYGIIKSGEYLVATVNGFGILVETIYLLLFIIYAPQNTKVKTIILAGILDVGVLGAAVVTTQLALHGEARIGAVGLMGAGLNILMYGSPLAAMIPNGTGFLLGATQLVLYGIYRNGKASKHADVSNGLEEGLIHEHLISSSNSVN